MQISNRVPLEIPLLTRKDRLMRRVFSDMSLHLSIPRGSRKGMVTTEQGPVSQQVHAKAPELPYIPPSLMSPQGAAGTSYLKKMQKVMVKMMKAVATLQPAVAITIRACAVDPSRAGFCQTCILG